MKNNTPKTQFKIDSTRFFKRYVQDLQEVNSIEGMKIFKGRSPFGAGEILLTECGGFYCEATDLVGPPTAFLHELYPLLTHHGLNMAFFYEIASGIPRYGGAEDLLNEKTFGKDQMVSDKFKETDWLCEQLGLNKRVLKESDIVLKGTDHFYQMGISRIGMPIYRHSWIRNGLGMTEQIYGVPRIQENHEARTIWFADDPLIWMFLKELVPDPVYIRPTTKTYLYNDYDYLIEGKEVICTRRLREGEVSLDTIDTVRYKKGDDVDVLSHYGQKHPSIKRHTSMDRQLEAAMEIAAMSIELLL